MKYSSMRVVHKTKKIGDLHIKKQVVQMIFYGQIMVTLSFRN